MQERTRFPLQVTAALPASLARLAEIAGDLWYAWNRPARELFSRLHPELWEACGHNPKAFLRQVAQQTLLAGLSELWRFFICAPMCLAVYLTLAVGIFRITAPLHLVFSAVRDLSPIRSRGG